MREAHSTAEGSLRAEAVELREQIAAWAEAKAKRLADADELIRFRAHVRKLEGQLSAQVQQQKQITASLHVSQTHYPPLLINATCIAHAADVTCVQKWCLTVQGLLV